MEEINKKDENQSNPHVYVFGETVDSWKEKRERRRERREKAKEDFKTKSELHEHYHKHYHSQNYGSGGAVWGLIVFFSGVMLLFNSIGVVPWYVWNLILPFWPVLLIIVGLRIILGHSWISRFITFLVALVFFAFIVLYALVGIGSPLVKHLSPGYFNSVNYPIYYR